MTGPVIELLGAPAAGKSSLAAALSSVPGTVVLKDHTPRDLPALTAACVRDWSVLLADPPPGIPRLRWTAWAGRVGAAPAVAGRHRRHADVVVFDQGPAYTLGRLMPVRRDPHGNHWWYRRACGTARLLALLVVLDADPEVLACRLRARDKEHPAAGMSEQDARGYLDAERQTCRVVAETLGRAGTRVLFLDTGRHELGEQVAAVRAAVAATVRSAQTPGTVRGRSG